MSKNILGKRIKDIRKQKKLTQSDLSKLTGFKQNTISSHENGKRGIDELDIQIYCEALKITPAELFGKEKEEIKIQPLPVREIPIVSQISAGLPIYAEENILEHTYIATKKLNTNKEIFGLRVNGDSMDKEFRDGDVVIIEKDAVVENGQIAVVQVNGYNATVKRVRYEKDRIILIPESNNPAHYPQVYSQDDEVKIIGKVVSSQKFY